MAWGKGGALSGGGLGLWLRKFMLTKEEATKESSWKLVDVFAGVVLLLLLKEELVESCLER